MIPREIEGVVPATPIRDSNLHYAIDNVVERLEAWEAMPPEMRAPRRAQFAEQLVLAVGALTTSDLDYDELLAIVRELVAAAVTDADACAFCRQDARAHASGCVIATAETALARADRCR